MGCVGGKTQKQGQLESKKKTEDPSSIQQAAVPQKPAKPQQTQKKPESNIQQHQKLQQQPALEGLKVENHPNPKYAETQAHEILQQDAKKRLNEKNVSAIKAESNLLEGEKIADSIPKQISAIGGTVHQLPSQISNEAQKHHSAIKIRQSNIHEQSEIVNDEGVSGYSYPIHNFNLNIVVG